MKIETAIRLFPRVITNKRLVHFIWDMEARSGLGLYPLCQMDFDTAQHGCIHGTFNVPINALTKFPEQLRSNKREVITWRYCSKCLKRIEELDISDYR